MDEKKKLRNFKCIDSETRLLEFESQLYLLLFNLL